MCIDASAKLYPYVIGLLPNCIISCSMRYPEIKNEVYTIALKGQSWNRLDCHIIQFVYIHYFKFSILGILLIFLSVYKNCA